MEPRNVELHVEELVLRGFPLGPGDRHGIAQAVEAELVRLFREQGLPPSLAQGGELAHLDGGAFDAGPNAGPRAVAAQIARAVYGGLSRWQSSNSPYVGQVASSPPPYESEATSASYVQRSGKSLLRSKS